MTCDGIIDVAVNSWPKSTNPRSWAKVTRAFFCPGAQSTDAISLYPARLAASNPGSRPDCDAHARTMSSQVTGLPSEYTAFALIS